MDGQDVCSRFYSAIDEIKSILESDHEMVKWGSDMFIPCISEIINDIAPRIRTKHKKKISNSLRLKVYKKDGYCCVMCLTDDDLSIDHIIPESKGGDSTIDNLQTLCRRCNSIKGVK